MGKEDAQEHKDRGKSYDKAEGSRYEASAPGTIPRRFSGSPPGGKADPPDKAKVGGNQGKYTGGEEGKQARGKGQDYRNFIGHTTINSAKKACLNYTP
jgi:hypothetical protein